MVLSAEEKKGVEDKFLKLTEMEKFLDRADAEDAGLDFEGSDDEDDEDDDAEGDEEDLEVLVSALFCYNVVQSHSQASSVKCLYLGVSSVCPHLMS